MTRKLLPPSRLSTEKTWAAETSKSTKRAPRKPVAAHAVLAAAEETAVAVTAAAIAGAIAARVVKAVVTKVAAAKGVFRMRTIAKSRVSHANLAGSKRVSDFRRAQRS